MYTSLTYFFNSLFSFDRKMPPATGDSDKTSLDVNNVTSKNGKISRNPLDHLKSFEVAVVLYKEDPNEKNMANIDKALQV